MSQNKPTNKAQKTGGIKPTSSTEYKNKKAQLKGQNPFETSLSPLSKAYALSLVDPFTGPLACVPAFPSVPSQKIRAFSKGFFSTGVSAANDFGFITMNPFAAVGNTSNFVSFSESAYGGSTISATFAAGSVNTVPSNSPFATAAFGTTDALAKFRIVSAGLRIRYTGTELNRGGVVVGFVHPTRSPVINSSFTDIDGQRLSRRFHPKSDGSWLTVLYCPSLTNDLQYNSAVGTLASAHMCFVLKAPTAAIGATFEYEAYVQFEVNGRDIAGMSPSGADPTGLAIVHTVANNSGMPPTDKPSSVIATSFFQTAEKWAAKTITEVVPKALDWAVSKAPLAIEWGLEAAALL